MKFSLAIPDDFHFQVTQSMYNNFKNRKEVDEIVALWTLYFEMKNKQPDD